MGLSGLPGSGPCPLPPVKLLFSCKLTPGQATLTPTDFGRVVMGSRDLLVIQTLATQSAVRGCGILTPPEALLELQNPLCSKLE